MDSSQSPSDLMLIADIEIGSVRHVGTNLVLDGTGADRSEYRVELHLDLPVDARTRTVLSGMLAQSEVKVWRRTAQRVRFRSVPHRQPGVDRPTGPGQ